jgi:hypothetical protein
MYWMARDDAAHPDELAGDTMRLSQHQVIIGGVVSAAAGGAVMGSAYNDGIDSNLLRPEYPAVAIAGGGVGMFSAAAAGVAAGLDELQQNGPRGSLMSGALVFAVALQVLTLSGAAASYLAGD